MYPMISLIIILIINNGFNLLYIINYITIVFAIIMIYSHIGYYNILNLISIS